MMGCLPPSLPAPGELLALNAHFASSLLGKDVVSQELVLVTWDSCELLAAGGRGASHPTLPLLSRSRQTQKQGLDMVFSGSFIQGNRLMWD